MSFHTLCRGRPATTRWPSTAAPPAPRATVPLLFSTLLTLRDSVDLLCGCQVFAERSLPPSSDSPHCLMALICCTAPTVGTLDLSSTHLCFICLHSPPLLAKKPRDPSRCQWTTRRGTRRRRCRAGCLLHPVSRRSPPRPYLWPPARGCPAQQPLGHTVSSKVSVSVRRPAKTDCQHLGLLLAR